MARETRAEQAQRSETLQAEVRAKIDASGGTMSEVEALLALIEDRDREAKAALEELKRSLAESLCPRLKVEETPVRESPTEKEVEPSPPPTAESPKPLPIKPSKPAKKASQLSLFGACGEDETPAEAIPSKAVQLGPPPIQDHKPNPKETQDKEPEMTKKALAKIPDDVKAVLTRATITPETLTLPPEQLDRSLYAACMKVVEAYGGKWNRGKKCHVLPPGAAEKIEAALERGAFVREQVLFQAFYTPAEVADRLVRWTFEWLPDMPNSAAVLEPSAGDGALIRAVSKHATFRPRFLAFDINPEAVAKIQRHDHFGGEIISFDRVECADFLTLEPEPVRVCVMNPPFSGGQDMAHVRRAFDWLRPGGVLGAIMSPAFTFHTTKAAVAFREWFEGLGGEVEPLEEGAFAESGTGVRTVMVRLRRPAERGSWGQ